MGCWPSLTLKLFYFNTPIAVIGLVLCLFVSAVAEPPITALVLTPDGQHYLTGSQAGIVMHRLSDRSKLESVATQLEQVNDLAFSHDGQWLLAIGGTPAVAGEAELTAWPDRKQPQRFKLSDDQLHRAAWSSDSRWFASAGQDNRCRLTRPDGNNFATYAGHSRSVLALAVLTKDQQLISGGIDQTLQLWSIDGMRERTLNNHTATVTDVALQTLANSSVRLASASEDRTVRLWQPEIGRMIRFVRLSAIPRRVAWLNAQSLTAACDDGSVHTIDAESMQIIATRETSIRPIYELAITSTGTLIGGEGGVELLTK